MKRLADIFGFKLRIFANEIFRRHPICYKVDDKRHCHSHAANASTACHHRGIEGDPVEHSISLTSDQLSHGMATTKITITLPNRQLDEIRKRVAAEYSPSVSGFIQQAVQKSLENAAQFRAMVEEALKETGGPLKPRERAWARKMLSARKRRTRPRKAA